MREHEAARDEREPEQRAARHRLVQQERAERGGAAKKPSRAASADRNTTDASIANALTGRVGYLRRYGR